jgi:uncharacterized protein
MRRHFLLASLALLIACASFALEIPPPPAQWVTDRAGILSGGDVQALNDKLRAFEQRSGAQFIIYIFPSLEQESLEDFTVRAAERWKVGQKKYDNGLILFVFIEERKLRVEVGYGLEQTITDAYSSRVIRQTIAPHFRRGDYAAGLNAATDQIIARIEGKEEPVPVARPGEVPELGSIWPLILIILVFLFVIGPLMSRGGCGCGGCSPIPLLFFPGPGITMGGRGGGWGGGGGGFGGFRGGGGGFGGGGASGGW